MTPFDQSIYTIKFAWGLNGLNSIIDNCDIIVIVDVLSFSTCVDVATSNGAEVFPYRYRDHTAEAYAKDLEASLARSRGSQGSYSLSPMTLTSIGAGRKVVLPSPNGSTLSLSTKGKRTISGCLRNAVSVAEFCQKGNKRVGIIASGEKWQDGSLRPALEDMVGAGAVIASLKQDKSPEAILAENAFLSIKGNLLESMLSCGSGQELVEKKYRSDVTLAAEYNCSLSVPILIEDRYINMNRN